MSDAQNPLIHFNDVSKVYLGDSVVLRDINFHVHPEEFISIVGSSGAGKTTLLKLILAEEKPTKGEVRYANFNIHQLPKKAMAEYRRRIGMVFQDFRLIPDKTAFENIAFAMEAAGRTDEEIESDVPYVLDIVGLTDKMWNFPQELSGGQKQRLAIARAIVNQPDVVIADEPTGNLDPANAYEVVEILRKINELWTTVLLTTHNPGVLDVVKSRVVTMENGEIVSDR